MGRQQVWVLAFHAAIAALVIIGATVLLALHDLDPQAGVAIYGAAIGLAGGAASSLAAVGQTVNGKSVMTQDTMDSMSSNLRAAVSYLAGARAEVDAAHVAGGRRGTDPPRQTEPTVPPPVSPEPAREQGAA